MLAFIGLGLLGLPAAATAQGTADARLIAEAVSPLPEPLRAGATVRVFRGGGLVTIRAGTNDMICLADDPAREKWHVACYHRDMEAFMARGRELRAEGRKRAAIDSIRLAEIESGRLQVPDHPTALYSLTGPEGSFDHETGEARGARGLFVVYMPYATEETSGVSAVPSKQRPWLMYAGRPWAHIMISR
ncbi:MAG: hypothetical protein ACE5JM_11650 [Armatimonadota bacterium]